MTDTRTETTAEKVEVLALRAFIVNRNPAVRAAIRKAALSTPRRR